MIASKLAKFNRNMKNLLLLWSTTALFIPKIQAWLKAVLIWRSLSSISKSLRERRELRLSIHALQKENPPKANQSTLREKIPAWPPVTSIHPIAVALTANSKQKDSLRSCSRLLIVWRKIFGVWDPIIILNKRQKMAIRTPQRDWK